MITWGTGSAFNMARIPGTDIRLERSRNQDKSWSFMVSNDRLTYLHVDNRKFPSMPEMEQTILQWIEDEKPKR